MQWIESLRQAHRAGVSNIGAVGLDMSDVAASGGGLAGRIKGGIGRLLCQRGDQAVICLRLFLVVAKRHLPRPVQAVHTWCNYVVSVYIAAAQHQCSAIHENTTP